MDLDTQVGIQALQTFYQRSLKYSAFGGVSFDSFLKAVSPHYLIYADGMGLEIRVNNLSDSKISDAMNSLADQAKGRIPSNPLVFQKALGNQSQQISWFEVAKGAAVDVGTQVGQGVVAVGDNALTIVSTLNKLIVPIAFIFIGGWLLANYKKVTK